MKTEATEEIMASYLFFVEKISIWSKVMWMTRLAMRLRGEDNSIEEMISLSKVSDKLLNKLVYDYMFRCVIKLRLAEDAQAPTYALRKTIALRQEMLQSGEAPVELSQLHKVLEQKVMRYKVHPCLRLAWAGTFVCPKESALAILREVSGWKVAPWKAEEGGAMSQERLWLRMRLAALLEKVEKSHGYLVSWLEKKENKERLAKMMLEEGVEDSQQAAHLLLRAVFEAEREHLAAASEAQREQTTAAGSTEVVLEETPSAEFTVLRAA